MNREQTSVRAYHILLLHWVKGGAHAPRPHCEVVPAPFFPGGQGMLQTVPCGSLLSTLRVPGQAHLSEAGRWEGSQPSAKGECWGKGEEKLDSTQRVNGGEEGSRWVQEEAKPSNESGEFARRDEEKKYALVQDARHQMTETNKCECSSILLLHEMRTCKEKKDGTCGRTAAIERAIRSRAHTKQSPDDEVDGAGELEVGLVRDDNVPLGEDVGRDGHADERHLVL